LGDSQWSLLDYHYRSLLASFMTHSPSSDPREPATATDLELRPRNIWSGLGLVLQCSVCRDPLCPTLPRPLTFHAIASTLICKPRPFQSRCERHTLLRRKHGPVVGTGPTSSSGPPAERDCAACLSSSSPPVSVRTQDAAVRTVQSQPQPLPSSPQSACLHLLAFALPLVLTLIGLTAAEIDGDALSGICFVGRINIWARVGLVLVPCAVCLVIKCVYLGRVMRSCMRLRRPFLRSPFPSDQEFAQRLVRCTYSYGMSTFFILLSLLSCQISHRLLGLDSEAALTACLGSASKSKAASSAIVDTHGARIVHDELSPTDPGGRTVRATGLSFARVPIEVSPQPSTGSSVFAATAAAVVVTRDQDILLGRLNPYAPSPAQIHKPMAGPILLHLLTYFVLNVIFASMCLFDVSVKHSWRKFWIRLRVSCRLGRWCGHLPTKRAINHSHAVKKLLCNCLYNNVVGFSWWDPGLFLVPLFHEDSSLAASSVKETSSTCELVHLADVLSSSDLKSRSLGRGDRLLSSDVASTSSCKIRGEDSCMPRDIDSQSPPADRLTGANPVNSTGPDFLVNTIDLPFHPVPAPFDDLIPHVARVISLYEHTSPDHPTLVFFRHLYDQLVQSTGSPTAVGFTTTVTANRTTTMTTASNSSPDHRHPDRPATASGLERRPNTASGNELVLVSEPAQSSLVRSMAALYDQCQKQLVAANNFSTRHRSRHRRLLPSRASARRKSQSRSLSTGGLHCPVSTSFRLSSNGGGGGGTSTGAGSIVSATSDHPEESLPELLRAAASVLAAAATGTSVRSPTDPRTSGPDSDRDTRPRQRRLSQSVISSTLSTQQLNQSSGVASGENIDSETIRAF
uniref:Frizzled domain-containing protein n=1 Tax=Echinostoma caproni TaxID=27848 RepID=A0A183AZG3_9TREM